MNMQRVSCKGEACMSMAFKSVMDCIWTQCRRVVVAYMLVRHIMFNLFQTFQNYIFINSLRRVYYFLLKKMGKFIHFYLKYVKGNYINIDINNIN